MPVRIGPDGRPLRPDVQERLENEERVLRILGNVSSDAAKKDAIHRAFAIRGIDSSKASQPSNTRRTS